MFRNKEIKQQLEQAEEMRQQLQENRRTFDGVGANAKEVQTEIDQINMSASRMDHSLTKVVDFARNTKDLQIENEGHLSELEVQLDDAKQAFDDLHASYEEKQAYIKNQQKKLLDLQEQSKRYTGLSKKVSDLSTKDGESIEALLGEVKELQKFVFSIGNLALQSAIEAGRMGDEGSEYIKTAEKIRLLAGDFAAQSEQIHAKLADLQSSQQEMDAQMHSFISLLKDNTVSIGKLSKDATEEIAKPLVKDKAMQDAVSDMKKQITDLQDDVTESKQTQELIMDEMESIGACYIQQQDSTATMEELIGNIKRMISNIELNEKDED